ncbi:hypothetical protein Pelo_19179 [Pelomyxa schiedti]|nr:hypothetical protein Pelo_19179 [Pelomyxa schiedti]
MGNEHARQATTTTTTSAAATTSAAVDVTNVDGGVPRSRDEEIQLARRRAKHNEKMEANFLARIGTNSATCDPHGLIRAAVKGNTHKLPTTATTTRVVIIINFFFFNFTHGGQHHNRFQGRCGCIYE